MSTRGPCHGNGRITTLTFMLEMPQTQLFCAGYVKICSLLSELCEFLYIFSISDIANTRCITYFIPL